MTKDVLVSVTGLQNGIDDVDKVETINKGSYYKKNGMNYVFLEEMIEGFDKPVNSMFKFSDGILTVTKKGLFHVNMIFEERKKNMSCYSTPYGEIMIGIDTEAVYVEEEENRIRITVDYDLEANYEHMARCKIEMDIRAKESGMPLQF